MLQQIEDKLLNCLEHKWGTAVVGLLCVGLVFPPWGYSIFKNTGDLHLNAWVVQYYQYIIDGLSLPSVINHANSASLNVFPLFYARPLHWLATMMTFFMPVRAAFWFILGFISWIQYCICAYAFTVGTQSRVKGNLIAAMVLLSCYALNNLYGRGAMAEYTAASLLVSFVCALLAMVGNPARKKELLILAAVFFSLLGNIHPTTTFSGTLCFFPLALYALFIYFTQQKSRWDIPVFLLASCIVAGSMAHFVYLVWVTDSMLYIQRYPGPGYLDGIDNLFLRFFPVPVNFLLYSARPLKEILSSPLVCQINVGLLVVLLASLMYATRRAIADKASRSLLGPVALGMFLVIAALFLTWISVVPSESPLINAWLRRVQFPYRLITQINILLMIGIFFLCPVLTRLKLNIPCGRQMLLLLAAGSFISMAQLYIITPDLKTIDAIIRNVDESIPARHVSAFYGAYDYATLPPFPVQEPLTTPPRSVQLIQPRHAAKTLRSEPIQVAQGEVLRLEVLPFVWNQVFVINQATGRQERLQGQQLKAADGPPAYYLSGLPEGTYVIEAAFKAPRIWRVLRSLSVLAALMGGASLLYMGWRWMRECKCS